MTDCIKRFEILILRPFQILLLVSAVIFIIKSMWWWLAGSVISILYLGIIGSKLHPLQSSAVLAQGPLDGKQAENESELIPRELKQTLVGHACTRVGILIGVLSGLLSWAAYGLHWYYALLIFWFSMVFCGGILKFAFKTIPIQR